MGASLNTCVGARCLDGPTCVVGSGARKRRSTAPGEYAPIVSRSGAPSARYRGPDFVTEQSVLGRGACGAVLRGSRVSDGALVALKKVERDGGPARAEISALKIAHASGHHPTIVQLLDVCDDFDSEGPHYIILALEHLAGGELYRQIVESGGLSEWDARGRFADLMGALAHLHAVGICHRDIKPENLLLTAPSPSATLKVADFGVCALPAEATANGRMKRMCGTMCFSAPEVWRTAPATPRSRGRGREGSSTPTSGRRGAASARGYTLAADIFSAGIVLFAMVAGYHPFDPFDEYDEDVVLRRMSIGGIDLFADPYGGATASGTGLRAPSSPPSVWDGVSPELKALVRVLLEPDDALRPSAARVLADPWLLDQCQRGEAKHPGDNGARMARFIDLRDSALAPRASSAERRV